MGSTIIHLSIEKDGRPAPGCGVAALYGGIIVTKNTDSVTCRKCAKLTTFKTMRAIIKVIESRAR